MSLPDRQGLPHFPCLPAAGCRFPYSPTCACADNNGWSGCAGNRGPAGEAGTDHKRRNSGGLLLLAGLALTPGCLSCSKGVELPPECVASCQAIAEPCRAKVYVFLVSGFDPFDVCDVA